ncbi:MAG: MOSC domain-containing protein [Actinomycetota bacterium]|nr:MOSC domain-containing protein [Actinomycetota bacterium]
MGDGVGTVSAVHRYPVKSMLGEVLNSARITGRGVDGDRAHALIDDETGKVISVKRPRRWGRIFELSAATGVDGVEVRFPHGGVHHIDDPELPARLSDFFGRSVSVASTPPDGASFDEAWVRDLKDGADPYLGLPSRLEEGDELIDAGLFMNAQDNFFNLGPVHLVTTGTTDRLRKLAPGSRFDPHRFRPNLVIETDADGFVETDWLDRTITIGEVQLAVTFNVPRCVMTTLAQGDLPADPDVLRTITRHNQVDPGFGTTYPCVGVYADVRTPGLVAAGDAVTID